MLWYCLGGYIVAAHASTPPVLVLQDAATSYPLLGHWAMLRDASASLDINAVADPRRASDFTPLSGDLALGYSSDAVWLRFAVQRAVGAPDEWWLSMEPGFLNNLTLYLPQPEGGFITQHSGTHIPLKERPIALPEAVFPVNFTQLMPEGTASVVMYLRLERALLHKSLLKAMAWCRLTG